MLGPFATASLRRQPVLHCHSPGVFCRTPPARRCPQQHRRQRQQRQRVTDGTAMAARNGPNDDDVTRMLRGNRSPHVEFQLTDRSCSYTATLFTCIHSTIVGHNARRATYMTGPAVLMPQAASATIRHRTPPPTPLAVSARLRRAVSAAAVDVLSLSW